MRNSLLVFVVSLHVVVFIACNSSGQEADKLHTTVNADPAVRGDATNGPVEQTSAPKRAFSRYTFSPDGRYVLADGGTGWWPPDGEASLWKASDGSCVRIVRSFEESPNVPLTQANRVNQVAFDPSGAVMVVARAKAPRPALSEYEIVVEKTATGEPVCALDLRPNVTPPTISLSHDGRYAVGSGSWVMGKPAGWEEPPLDIWDARTGQRIWDPNQPVPYPLAEFQQKKAGLLREVSDQRLSKDDAEADLKLLLVLRDVRKDDKRLIVRGTLQTHGPSYFSPDGRWLVTRDGIMPRSDYSSEAVIWDAKRCRLVCEFYEDDTWLEPFIFTSDGDRFIRRAYEKPRRIHESASGQPIREFPELPNARCLALAPHGNKALLITRQEAVLFDTESGRLIKRFTVPDSSPRAAAFSPGVTAVAIEFRDHSVDRFTSDKFRDRVNVYAISDECQKLFSLEPPPLAHRYRWYPAAYNADGTRLLYGGALWDGDSGNKIRQFRIVDDLPSR